MRFRVQVGENFEVESFRVIENDIELQRVSNELEEAKNRTLIVWVFLGLVVVFLIGSAILGLSQGNFDNLQAVYNVAAVPISGLVGYYFAKKRDQEK